jgi:hypothetical protein
MMLQRIVDVVATLPVLQTALRGAFEFSKVNALVYLRYENTVC